MKTNIYFLSFLAHFFLEWETFQTKVVEEIKTHIYVQYLFFFENRAVYEIMWENIVQPGRRNTTIWRMCVACWIPKVTHTHTHTHTKHTQNTHTQNTHTHTKHTHTKHTHTKHTHTHKQTHTHTKHTHTKHTHKTHTHLEHVIFIAFPLQ
jgi:hypothetical protein